MMKFLTLGILFLAVGCGKKTTDKNAGPWLEPVKPTDIEELLNRQEVGCESGQACPNYLTKIAIINNKKLNFCTGILVDEDVVATSTSCLPTHLRRGGQDCSRDLFFFFPKSSNRPEDRKAKCTEVLQVSSLEGDKRELWRDDLAFLKLDKRITNRRKARFAREGLINNREYSAWFVDQIDEVTALIRKENCEALHKTYLNPLVENELSPNMIFGNCQFKNGNSGAPILDKSGKVRAIVSGDIDPQIKSYLNSTGLLLQPLRPMVHATNLSCAPTIFDTDVADEKECFKKLSDSTLADRRSALLSTVTLFGDMRNKFEASLDSISAYIRFGVKVTSQGDIQETTIYPKCFKPLATWLATLNGTRNNYVFEVNLPFKTFRRAMDASGRLQGVVQDLPAKKYYMQFSLKSLRSTKKSIVFMWREGENYNFPELSENCSE